MVSITLLQVVFEVEDLSKAVGKAVKMALTSSVEMFSEGTEGTWKIRNYILTEGIKVMDYYSHGKLSNMYP